MGVLMQGALASVHGGRAGLSRHKRGGAALRVGMGEWAIAYVMGWLCEGGDDVRG